MAKYITSLALFLCLLLGACEDYLDKKIDTTLAPDEVFVSYGRIKDFGYGVYSSIPHGFNRIDGALLAGATDEAEHTWTGSRIQSFNLGGWGPYNNPDDSWANYYTGIRKANMFLEKTIDYRNIIFRDTITADAKKQYANQARDVEWMRNEVRFLRAYFYFELIKRYGGVPLITSTLSLESDLDLPRQSFDECANFIVSECDSVLNKVKPVWADSDIPANETGRVTKGTVMALKSRALLYAASPLHNPENNKLKWEAAAKAAHELIALKQYTLHNNYRNLFITPDSYRSNEVIFARRYGQTNSMERENYPVGTEGGQSGTCPSQNLVDAYEKLPGWDPANPYEKVDPRLQMTVVVNNSTWNGRKIESWVGGRDGRGKNRATRTGYYLKKYVFDNLDLSQNRTSVHAWILFRYAEILLNYAEAMNEAFGPTANPKGYSKTALQALNDVRARAGVNLAPLTASSDAELRENIKHERMIELAFEEHRHWDLRRWKDAEQTLNEPLYGMEITKNEGGLFTYKTVKVEERVFDPKMYIYPIPQDEINKSASILQQTPGW